MSTMGPALMPTAGPAASSLLGDPAAVAGIGEGGHDDSRLGPNSPTAARRGRIRVRALAEGAARRLIRARPPAPRPPGREDKRTELGEVVADQAGFRRWPALPERGAPSSPVKSRQSARFPDGVPAPAAGQLVNRRLRRPATMKTRRSALRAPTGAAPGRSSRSADPADRPCCGAALPSPHSHAAGLLPGRPAAARPGVPSALHPA